MRTLTLSILLALLSFPVSAQIDPKQKEEFSVVIKHLLKDDAGAAMAINEAVILTYNTPFEFDATSDAIKRLINLGIKPIQLGDILTVSADTSVGVQSDRFSQKTAFVRMAEAIGQMLLQSDKESPEKYIWALEIAGVPAHKILADDIGITEKEVREYASRGAFEGPKTAGWIMKYCEKKYGGLAKKLADSRQKD